LGGEEKRKRKRLVQGHLLKRREKRGKRSEDKFKGPKEVSYILPQWGRGGGGETQKALMRKKEKEKRSSPKRLKRSST